MRRRRQLEVSTFPFLAVLLCTMGALILLLLVLDRRAKIVALNKAKSDYELVQAENDQRLELSKAERDRREQVRQRQRAEAERLAQERQAEWEERSRQLHAVLAQQEEELLGQIEKLQGQVVAADARLQSEKTRAEEQDKLLQLARMRLSGLLQTTKEDNAAVTRAAQQSAAAKQELDRQTLALAQLEQTLANLKALRERQKTTYSLVPYLGRRGDSRRPIYLECGGNGVVFHPDRLALDLVQLTAARLRAEVEQRISRQQQATPGTRPYLLMLVRPDGIGNYYRTQQALAGLELDFGYEFIEQDWVMDFTAEGENLPPSWTSANKLPAQIPGGLPPPPGINGVGGGFASLGGPGGASAGTVDKGAGGTAGQGPGGTSASGGVGGPFPGGANYRGLGGGPGGPGQGFGGLPGTGGGFGGVGEKGVGSLLGGVGEKGPGSASAGGGDKGGGGFPGVADKGGGRFPAVGDKGGGGFPADGDKGVDNALAGTFEKGSGGGGVAGPRGGGPSTSAGRGDGVAPSGEKAVVGIGQPTPLGQAPGTGGGPALGGATNKGEASGGPGSLGGMPQLGAPTSGGSEKGAASGAKGGPAGMPNGLPPTAGGAGGNAVSAGSNGQGDPSNAGQESPANGVTLVPPLGTGSKSNQAAPPTLGRVLGNRDWPIYIECNADGVMVQQGKQKFSLESLKSQTQGEHPLAQAIRQMIARRQATVRQGEAPYRPLLRFQVQPDGFRAYYLAYPLLEQLRLPMMRENMIRQ